MYTITIYTIIIDRNKIIIYKKDMNKRYINNSNNINNNLYRTYNLNGDGVVDSSFQLDKSFSLPEKVVKGNLGVYSGEEPLPETYGQLYNMSSYYDVLANSDMDVKNVNKNGLIPVNCDVKKVANPYFGNGQKPFGYFYPFDGRTIDVIRNIPLVLDKKAESGSVHMDDVAYFDNRNYGSNYKSYKDIKNGQITYYTDSSVNQPFVNPVYILSSTVDKVIRKDPMDSIKPEYIKNPISSTLNYVSKDQATRDALSHREDIMSRQQNLYNRTKWTAHWE